MTEHAESQLDLHGLEEFLSCSGHSLVLGGPGSGKTTAALVKASQEIAGSEWRSYQQVLFLSFARATVARIAEAAGQIIDKTARDRIELTTYHSFAWRLLRSHGYLIQNEPPIRLLPPHDAAARLTDAGDGDTESEKHRLLLEEGLLHFDLFAELTANLLQQSEVLARIVSRRYPLIFLDEFQDTNSSEWRLTQCLIRYSRVICLADAEQRIYEFRGADPKRIEDFVKHCSPDQFDLAQRNHRSNGKDILQFANDLLSGTNSSKAYSDVAVQAYPPRRGVGQHLRVKTELLAAINRLKNTKQGWSIAILVPTKKMMLIVSDCLSQSQTIGGSRTLPSLSHEVSVDAEGPALAGVAIGRLMESRKYEIAEAKGHLIEDLCRHIVGRKSGRPPSQAESKLIGALRGYLAEGKVVGVKRQRIISECGRIAVEAASKSFVGDPYADWVSIRDIVAAASEPELQCIAADSHYLSFLRKGANLRARLSALWQNQSNYSGATEAVQNAFIQEHFAATSREPRGVYVMTIHKAKGKEFDEVLIYEGIHADRIVRNPEDARVVAQARLALRVAVSRARTRVTIVTPQQKPCELL